MDQEVYLRAILATMGRIAFPPERLFDLISPGNGNEKAIRAYNLCDSTHTQAQIAISANIDKGNLSRLLKRWIEAGIVFRVGDGKDARPLHIYPVQIPR